MSYVTSLVNRYLTYIARRDECEYNSRQWREWDSKADTVKSIARDQGVLEEFERELMGG